MLLKKLPVIGAVIFMMACTSGLNAQTANAPATTVALDVESIMLTLQNAPAEGTDLAKTTPFSMTLPTPDGSEAAYTVEASDVMVKSFYLLNPNIKTYKVFNEATLSYGRMVVSPFGLHALIFTQQGSYYIQALDKNDPVIHRVFYSKSEAVPGECGFDPTQQEFKDDLKRHFDLQNAAEKDLNANGATRRTYRMAITTTGEFHQDADFGNNNFATTLAEITQVVSDNSAKYELELAVTLLGVVVNAAVYTDPGTDPFVPDQSNGVSRTSQSAAVIGQHYNSNDYDLGHCLHATASGGSGVAGLGVVCNSGTLATPPGYATGGTQKGRGWSGGSNYVSLVNNIMYHEVGHQFDMEHTFNGIGGSCTGAIADNNAYEIGSGTTIMSYSGSCQADNNIPYGPADEYFHTKSLEQALAYITASGGCAATVPSGNNPPTVSANPCGGAYTIPKSTPFKLAGSGSDPDGDQVFYTWEQIDEDGAGTPTQGFIGATAGASTIAPLFRSYPPSTSPVRYFPNLGLVQANNYSSSFEPLPSVARTLNFRLTARDNKVLGGGIVGDDLAVTVSASGPFQVTAPNGGETLTAGNNTTVTWAVNGTNAFCNNVNIKMSIDGGATFPYTLLASTPNDGSQSVTIPAGVTNTTTARIMVECADNTCVVFFDISNGNFSVTSTCSAATNNICPPDPVTLPPGDPGLNFTLTPYFGGAITSQAFDVTGADPNMNVHAHDLNYMGCNDWGFTSDYEFIDFTVDKTGSYTFSNFSSFAGFAWGNIHTAAGFSTANPCNTFLASSASRTANNGVTTGGTVTLNLTACTLYKLVVMGFSAPGAGTVNMSGAGNILISGLAPGANYSYTYAAVNTATNQVAAVSATSDFTGLAGGSYQVYGASYYSGPGPNPATVNPATWVGQTIAAILSGGNCVLFSNNFKPVTVTGGGGGTPTISIAATDANKAEGNAGMTAFTFTVTRTGDVTNQTTADWAVTGSGANPANGADFSGGNFPNGTVTFPAGSAATQTITVNVNGDVDVEPNEGFTVTLSNPTNATITTAAANGTIQNDDAAPGYCAAGATATTDEKISNVQFNTINNASASTAGYEDFTAVTTTVQQGSTHLFTGTISNPFASDEIIVWIDFNQDLDFEDAGEEVFNSPTGVGPHSGNITIPGGAMTGNTRMRVRLHDSANGPNATPCGNSTYGQVEDYTINITSAVPVPSIAIAATDANKAEGNAGMTAFTFTVTRTGDVTNQTTADWAVTGSGANPANGADFSGGNFPNGTVTFPAGSMAAQTITVNVNGDVDVEPDEGFTVTLSNPTNATITTAAADGTIQNDDAAAGYCTAGATNTCCEKISNVEFNTINNASASTAGYEDFTAVTTTVQQGSTHNFTGTISGGYNEDEIIVWIDFNQDQDFDDPGEEVFNSPIGVGPHSGNITIPANAMTGATRMRVRLHDTTLGPNTTPCGNSTYGQVEDYTINITTGGGACPNTLAVPGTIASGTYHAAMDLTSNGTVPNTNTVIFKAGTSILLEPEFEVQVGATFDALIEVCTPFAPPGNGQ